MYSTTCFWKLFIGVHVRKTDFEDRYATGYNSAPLEYYIQAIDWFKKNQSESESVFIVASDDKPWARENLLGIAETKVYVLSAKNSAEVDLAVLARCQHTIMSAGTYSFWAAYLAGGTATYYSQHPRPGSALFERCPPKDYFLPQWIPLP